MIIACTLVKQRDLHSGVSNVLNSIEKWSRLSELSIISWVSTVNPLILKIKFSFNVSHQLHNIR